MRPFILTGWSNHHFIALPLIEFSTLCLFRRRPVILFYRSLLRCSRRFFAPTVHTSSKYYDYFSLTQYSISYLTTFLLADSGSGQNQMSAPLPEQIFDSMSDWIEGDLFL
jgi:hypothetical protein